MSGSSMSFNTVTLVGCRVAGTPVYTPSHIPTGKTEPIRQMASFSIYQNLNGNTPSRFRVTAWGNLADVIAKSCAPGKELTLSCELNSYKGKIPIPNQTVGQPVQFIMGPDGQPITIEKVGLTVRRIMFGQDSNKQIAAEIQRGERKPLWNVEGHPDNIAWKETCNMRNSIQYTPGMTKFGYAEVRQPNGQIVQTQQPTTSYPQYTQGFTGVTPVQQTTQGFTGVTQGFTGITQEVPTPPIQGTPVQQPATPGFTGITQGFTGTTPVPPTTMSPAAQQPVGQTAAQPAVQPATQQSVGFAM